MRTYSLSHLPDATLLRGLAAIVVQDRTTTAAMLAHLAEVDARRLYLPAAYPSMYAYCVGELGLPEEAAFKRIRVARTARQVPAIFAAIADGRLHLSAVVLLSPYLTPENADELLAAAAHRSKTGIEQLLAERFPRPDLPTRLEAGLPSLRTAESRGGLELSPGTVPTPPESGELNCRPSSVMPLAPQRFALQVTLGQATHDKLRYAQTLLGHQVPSREIGEVLDRALDALIAQLERRKFAACRRPRRGPRRESRNPRHIPAAVKRAVWERDGGRCTFVSEAGRRCPARTRLEFDHLDPVARGGHATVAGVRLRCRAHNQYAAEQVYGAAFMREKREEAQRAAVEKRAAAGRGEAQRAQAEKRAQEDEVVPWLRALGFGAGEARRGAAECASMPGAPLEERVRAALAALTPARGVRGLGAAAMQTATC